jgi:hypothetical protein
MKSRTQKHISPGHFTRSLLQNAKQSLLYLLVFMLLALALSCICLLPDSNDWFDGLKALQLSAFMAIGFIHTSQLYKRLSFLHRNFSGEGLWFTLLLLTLVLLSTTVLYMLVNPGLLPVSLACSGAFLFPFLMYRAWFFYSHIPPGVYTVWHLPEDDAVGYSTGSRNGQPVRIKLARSYFEVKDELFQVTATPQTRLGRLLYNVVAEQSKMPATIQLKDEDDKPFGWEFYAKGLLGLFKRRLNPEKSLLSNKVKKNTVVLVKRVRTETEPLAQQMIAV